MRKNALLATLALATVALATGTGPGIEVLGIEVLSGGATLTSTQSTNVPIGAYVEAVMTVNGQEAIVDVQAVDSAGQATLLFPANMPGNRVDLYDATGVLLASDYVDGLELD